MPYEWLARQDGGPARLRAWPHRSLGPRGFVAFIAATSVLIALPLIALLGTPVLWGLLPFLAGTVALIWWALRRNGRDLEILEELVLGADRVTLTRRGPHGRSAEWQANPYWVRPVLHRSGGPVPHYLTLQGGPREVELGRFLSEEERIALHADLLQALRP